MSERFVTKKEKEAGIKLKNRMCSQNVDWKSTAPSSRLGRSLRTEPQTAAEIVSY